MRVDSLLALLDCHLLSASMSETEEGKCGDDPDSRPKRRRRNADAGGTSGPLSRSMILQTALRSLTARVWTDCPCAASATQWAAIR